MRGVGRSKPIFLFASVGGGGLAACCFMNGAISNGNASETKANESFDNSVFFDIETKRTPLLEIKLFLKRSEHIR